MKEKVRAPQCPSEHRAIRRREKKKGSEEKKSRQAYRRALTDQRWLKDMWKDSSQNTALPSWTFYSAKNCSWCRRRSKRNMPVNNLSVFRQLRGRKHTAICVTASLNSQKLQDYLQFGFSQSEITRNRWNILMCRALQRKDLHRTILSLSSLKLGGVPSLTGCYFYLLWGHNSAKLVVKICLHHFSKLSFTGCSAKIKKSVTKSEIISCFKNILWSYYELKFTGSADESKDRGRQRWKRRQANIKMN